MTATPPSRQRPRGTVIPFPSQPGRADAPQGPPPWPRLAAPTPAMSADTLTLTPALRLTAGGIVACIGAAGSLDSATVGDLLAACRWAIARNIPRVLIEASGLGAIDVPALEALARLQRDLFVRDGWVAVCAPTLAVREALASLPPTMALPVYADEASALAALLPPARVGTDAAGQRVAEADAWLILPDGSPWPLVDEVLTIGRGVGNHLLVADPAYGLDQAVIVRIGAEHLLFHGPDTEALATMINGHPIRDLHLLRNGDQLALTAGVMTFATTAPTPAARSIPPLAPSLAAQSVTWDTSALDALRDGALARCKPQEGIGASFIWLGAGPGEDDQGFVFADPSGRRWRWFKGVTAFVLLAAVLITIAFFVLLQH